MKLYRHMALSWNSFFFALWVVVLPVIGMDRGQGWAIGYSLLMALQLYLVQPDFSRYLTFGLSTRVWNGHRRINASLAFLLMLVSAPWGFPWWVIIAPAAVWVLCMVRRFEPSRLDTRSLIDGSEGDSSTGWFSASPVSQIVLRPQARTWMWVAMSVVFATAITFVVSKLWDKGIGIAGAIVTLIVVPLVLDAVRSSLKDAVSFGLPRESWATATLLCTAIPVALALLADLAAFARTGEFVGATIIWLASTALLLSLAITDKRTWIYMVALVGIIAAAFSAWLLTPGVTKGWMLAGMAVIYLAWGAAYRRMAKRVDVFSPGLMGWLGVN